MSKLDLEQQYRNAKNLEARIALHSRYASNPTPWFRWVFAQLKVTPGARVLDLGCGPARVWRDNLAALPADLSLTLVDQSAGMLAEAGEALRGSAVRCRFVQDRAESFCAEAASFDLILACHMLYYVSDRPRLYRRLRTLLAPGGRFIAATNGRDNMKELRDGFVGRVLYPDGNVTHEQVPFAKYSDGWFYLENGREELRQAFGDVEQIDYEDTLRVTDPSDLLAYIGSYAEMSTTAEQTLRQHYETLRQQGPITITKATGLLATRPLS